jgi:hypothetical protein
MAWQSVIERYILATFTGIPLSKTEVGVYDNGPLGCFDLCGWPALVILLSYEMNLLIGKY